MGPEKNHLEPSLPVHFQLLEIWERTLGVPVRGIDESFFDLGGNSLLLAPMMEEVEEVTGQYVPITTFVTNPTIEHLAECLRTHAAAPDEIVELQRGSGGVPFYYFHGDILGGGFYARKLAQHLDDAQPVYAVAPTRIPAGEIPTVEQIAARRCRILRRHRPHGPYLLGGFCIGALVAYEVARQLVAAGEEVTGVILVNPELSSVTSRWQLKAIDRFGRARRWPPAQRVDVFLGMQRRLGRLRDLAHSPVRETVDCLLRKGKGALGLGQSGEGSASAAAASMAGEARSDWPLPAFHWVVAAFDPKPYAGPVKLFVSEDNQRSAPYLARRWRKVAPQTEIESIPGGHLTAITTHVDVLAEKVRAELIAFRTATLPFMFSLQVAAQI